MAWLSLSALETFFSAEISARNPFFKHIRGVAQLTPAAQKTLVSTFELNWIGFQRNVEANESRNTQFATTKNTKNTKHLFFANLLFGCFKKKKENNTKNDRDGEMVCTGVYPASALTYTRCRTRNTRIRKEAI